MTKTYPNFYKNFKCIAAECKHSCCIGWDVSLDEDTYNKYLRLSHPYAEKIRESIYLDNEGAHFKMRKDGCCPHLKAGLCELITRLGEDALCDICRLHPRFLNFYKDRTETGLGLCCEEAARLTLLSDTPFSLENDGDDGFCRFRKKIFSLLQNRSLSIDKRAENMLSLCGGAPPQKTLSEWADIFLSLERLSPKWDKELSLLKKPAAHTGGFDTEFEQLLCYFIFRHLDAEDIATSVSFCYLSFYIIREIFFRGEQTGARLCDIARQYSAEIEYSDQNISLLIHQLC